MGRLWTTCRQPRNESIYRRSLQEQAWRYLGETMEGKTDSSRFYIPTDDFQIVAAYARVMREYWESVEELSNHPDTVHRLLLRLPCGHPDHPYGQAPMPQPPPPRHDGAGPSHVPDMFAPAAPPLQPAGVGGWLDESDDSSDDAPEYHPAVPDNDEEDPMEDEPEYHPAGADDDEDEQMEQEPEYHPADADEDEKDPFDDYLTDPEEDDPEEEQDDDDPDADPVEGQHLAEAPIPDGLVGGLEDIMEEHEVEIQLGPVERVEDPGEVIDPDI